MLLSVQLYSVRDALDADLPGTIGRLAQLGLTHVEPYNFVALSDELATSFSDNGITAPTGHAPLLSTNQEDVFAAAERLGIHTVIDPYIPEEHWLDAGSIKDTARRLNDAAKLGAAHGVRVGYHNHWWELEHAVDGVPALEYFESLLDPEVVLEVDTYWAAVGGADVPGLLDRLGGRVVAIHIKDGPQNLDMKAQLPAGRGTVDVAGFLAAATSAEVGVIEFDDYSGDIFEGIAESASALRTLRAWS